MTGPFEESEASKLLQESFVLRSSDITKERFHESYIHSYEGSFDANTHTLPHALFEMSQLTKEDEIRVVLRNFIKC